MSALEIILVFAAVVLALVYLFRIGFKKPDGSPHCSAGGCACAKPHSANREKQPPGGSHL